MDNFDDTESNHSYQSDSLQSNASSLSGLSFYGNEFAELRHEINPVKYPPPYFERNSTPKAELTNFENEDQGNILKANLQKSLELNEQYKNDIRNLEKEIELKFYSKIDKLIRTNVRLEGELETANNQIERIIKNYKEHNEVLVTKEKLDLEKEIYHLTTTNSSLQIQCAALKHEKDELDLENRELKINQGEFLTDKEIKNASIQSLKQKISEQHIEIQNCRKSNSILLNQFNILDTKLQQLEKARDWYKNELHQCQNNVKKSEGESFKDKNLIVSLNQHISSLKIEISKYKNDIDRVRLQALREKEVLFKKLENINLNCTVADRQPSVVHNTKFNNNGFTENSVIFYNLTIEDLKQELLRLKLNIQEHEEEFEKQKQENCDLIARCLVLQKNLQHNENDIEVLHNSKKELVKRLEYLKESEKEKVKENLQLKNRITEVEIELKIRNDEKQSVEDTIGVIRNQFLKFKESHEKANSDLICKNKEILQLRQEKQELFMNNNWTICELEKTKQKDVTIDNLKRDIVNFEILIKEQTGKTRDLEFEILKYDRKINEKEKTIREKVRELEDYNSVIIQYKALTSEYENKINFLQDKLKEVENVKNELVENFKIVKEELNRKDLELDMALKNAEQLQNDHKTVLQTMSLEHNRMLGDYKDLEEKYIDDLRGKEDCITELNNKFKKLEDDCENYKKRITDDQKVEMLRNHKNATQIVTKVVDFKGDLSGCKIGNNSFNLSLFCKDNNFEKMIKNYFDNMNVEELESTVKIRLKYLDEKLQKIKTSCEEKMEKFQNLYGNEKITELEILLQVKERDMVEKQKKMDRSNRTLLRKVKEHMRGRNSAEKQLKYLQDLYNALSDECNTLKLQISSKEYTIQGLEKLCENYKNQSDKLRTAVLHLEKDLSKNKICEKCLEVDQLRAKVSIIEELQEINSQLKNKIRYNEENVLQLAEKMNEKDLVAKSLQDKVFRKSEEHKSLLTTLMDLEIKYSDQTDLIQKLSQQITEKEDVCVGNHTTIERLKEELEQGKVNCGRFTDEIKVLSSSLQQKVEYSEELMQSKAELENNFCLQNSENEILVADLRNSLVLLQNEMENLKNDKFFLQRLSNDLKVALRSYMEYNKNLKEQINLLTKEKQPFNSLPPNILGDISISGKYDEKYIVQLLEDNKVPAGNPLTTEIQGCLSKLREEIFTLQDQIVKKNSVGN